MPMRPIRVLLKTFVSPGDTDRTRLALLSLMEGLVQANCQWLKAYPKTIRLYNSPVVYRPEVDTEDWQDIPTTIERGYGDCEDLACWRCAELRVFEGTSATPFIMWRDGPNGAIYHALVKLPDGRIEDPSRAKGMRHSITNAPVILGRAVERSTPMFLIGSSPSLRARRHAAAKRQSTMGFSFNLKKRFKNVKNVKKWKVNKKDWGAINKVAQAIGPMVAKVYPEAAPAIVGAMALTNAAASGDQAALAQVAATQAAAQSGDPSAQQALQIMQTAQTVKGQVQSSDAMKVAVTAQAVVGGSLWKRFKHHIPGVRTVKALKSMAHGKFNAREIAEGALSATPSGSMIVDMENASRGKV